ncbi:MAG: hypothetical protein AB7O67_08690 [Vicinamibacterales bacterium]
MTPHIHPGSSARRSGIAAAALLAAATATAAQPAPPASTRWEPWLGCWQLTEDTATGPGAARGAEVCVSTGQASEGAVFATRVAGQPALTETLVADGTSRPVTDEGCTGTTQVRWSADGQRVFATSDVACDGGATQHIAGLSFIVPGPVWLDVQAVDSAGRQSVRVRRYVPSAATATRLRARGARLDVDDVIEASRLLPAAAVQAALVESRSRFALTGRQMLAMDDAGVADSITDLMVAISYPDRFIVDRRSATPLATTFDDSPWPFIGADAFYWSPYYYAPFGYSYWGNYWGPYGGGGVVIIDPGGGGGGTPAAVVDGRAVNGRGYTQVRRRDPEPGPFGPGGSGATSGAAGGSSSPGTVSSGGYSDGGSGGAGGGRTAVPRPPGGR